MWYLVSYGVLCHYGDFFGWHLLWTSEQILVGMMDEIIHWPKPYLLLLAAHDEILSWMIEIWMTNHLVRDNNYNIVNPKEMTIVNYKEWQIMLG